MFKISLVGSACLCLFAWQPVQAQTTPSAADLLRNIEQLRTAPSSLIPKPTHVQTPEQNNATKGIENLVDVIVISPLFDDALHAFWATEINRSVSADKMTEFNAYAWNLFQRKGYLPYISTQTKTSDQGSTLVVHVSLPKLGSVTATTPENARAHELAQEVLRRFTDVYKRGMPIDIQGFESQLTAISYDLPVEVEVSLRQTNATEVDVSIQVSPLQAKLGSFLGGTLQGNNYGLTQFGRSQLLGAFRFAGFTPSSELTLTTQQSHGISYLRADYELPIEGSRSRVRVYSSLVHSRANDSRGTSHEMGAAVTKLLHSNRSDKWLGSAELLSRTNQNWALDVLHSDRIDNQLRFKIRTESSNAWVDNFTNEVVLSIGEMDLGRLPSDKEADASSTGLNVAGTYKKIEMMGALSQSLDTKHIYTGHIRWKAQAASKNLDGYNRIALGGINGIRAFSPLEGVGDQGAHVSFDITHQIVPDVWGGLFYDIGIVKNNHTALINATDTGYYTLQGAGWQIGGKIEQINWNLSTAHATSKTPGPGVWSSTNTQVGDMRVNFSLTYAF